MQTPYIAALPMYFAPQEAVQAVWETLREVLRAQLQARLGAAAVPHLPATLLWPQDYHAHWLSPALLLSQTCGYPLSTRLAGHVQLVGTLAYDVPGAQGVYCRSALVCRADDARSSLEQFAQSTLAYNATDSQSGYNALRAMVAALVASAAVGAGRFFAQARCTGSHGQSLAQVAQGAADMAAVDCVTLALWQQAQPQAAQQLRVWGYTEAYPGLPLITARSAPAEWVQALQASWAEVAQQPQYAALRAPLRICGFEPLPLSAYQVCVAMQDYAQAQGCEAL